MVWRPKSNYKSYVTTRAHATDEDGINAVDEETESELPLCEAPCSFSTILDLGPRTTGASQPRAFARNFALFPHHVSHRELPFATTDLQWHFSVPLDQRVRQSPRSIVGQVGQGSRSSDCLVVVVVSLFAVLGRCVVQRSTGRRLVFVIRSRVASPRGSRSPARPVRSLLSRCRPPVAAFALRSYFAHRAWRLSCGRQKTK